MAKPTPKRYDVFIVDISSDGKPTNKRPAKKKQVSIHEHEAELQNDHWKQTKMIYELAEKQPGEKNEKAVRAALFAEAETLGLNPAKNIKTDALKEQVEKAREEN